MNEAIVNNPFNDIAQSPIVDGALLAMVGWSTGVAVLIAAILAIIKLGKVYYDDEMESIENQDIAKERKWKEKCRIAFIALLIVGYTAWMTPLVGFMTLLNRITTADTEMILEDRQRLNAIIEVIKDGGSEANWINHVLENNEKFSRETVEFAQREQAEIDEYSQNMLDDNPGMEFAQDATNYVNPKEEYLKNQAVASSPEAGKENNSKTNNLLMRIGDLFGNIGEKILGGMFYHLALFFRGLIILFAKFLFKMLIVIGPLALATSMYWEDNAGHWFKIFLNTGMVLTTINLLDGVMTGFVQVFYKYTTGMYQGDSVAFAIFMCGAYLSVFKITSWWVGKADAGRVVSKSIAAGAAGIGLALGSILVAKGASLGGSTGSLQKIASSLAQSTSGSRKKIQDE